MQKLKSNNAAFTLIEISIVLVIIGLLVGGVLVGKDLIKSSEIRSQISQIEGFTTAVNTFKVKYGYLPGDMPPDQAAQLGFFTFTGPNAGAGELLGCFAFGNNDGAINNGGEFYPFWSHLSDAKMINGNYGGNAGSLLYDDTTVSNAGQANTDQSILANVAQVLPQAKLSGADAFVTAYGNHYCQASDSHVAYSNTQKSNMFEIVAISNWNPIFSSFELYSIDSKIDDGLPATGNVRDTYTQDGGGGTFYTDDVANYGFACTTDKGGTKLGLAQEYDLSPTTANDKNCVAVDFLF